MDEAAFEKQKGGEDYVDMSESANERARDFRLLEGCLSSPSPDTFERLMSAVELSEIELCLKKYGRKFLDTLSEKQVVLDGKKLLEPVTLIALDIDAEHILNGILVAIEGAAGERHSFRHFGIEPFEVDIFEGNLTGTADDIHQPDVFLKQGVGLHLIKPLDSTNS